MLKQRGSKNFRRVNCKSDVNPSLLGMFGGPAYHRPMMALPIGATKQRGGSPWSSPKPGLIVNLESPWNFRSLMDSIFLGGGGEGAMMTHLPFPSGSNSDPLLWGRLLLGCMDADV